MLLRLKICSFTSESSTCVCVDLCAHVCMHACVHQNAWLKIGRRRNWTCLCGLIKSRIHKKMKNFMQSKCTETSTLMNESISFPNTSGKQSQPKEKQIFNLVNTIGLNNVTLYFLATVMRWLALLPYSNKVWGSNLGSNQCGVCMFFPVHVFMGFLQTLRLPHSPKTWWID